MGKKKEKVYDGNWGDMDEDFRDELKSIITNIFVPSNLTTKAINGKSITCTEYEAYIKSYIKLFQLQDIPETKAIFEMHVEKQMQNLIDDCISTYKQEIHKSKDLIINEAMIPVFHELGRKSALTIYLESKKLGGVEIEKKFKEILEKKIQIMLTDTKEQSKKLVKRIEEEKQKIQEKADEERKREREKMENESKRMQEQTKLQIDKLQKEIKEQKLKNARELTVMKEKSERDQKALEARYDSEKMNIQRKLKNERETKDKHIANLMRNQAKEMEIFERNKQIELAKKEQELEELKQMRGTSSQRSTNSLRHVLRLRRRSINK